MYTYAYVGHMRPCIYTRPNPSEKKASAKNPWPEQLNSSLASIDCLPKTPLPSTHLLKVTHNRKRQPEHGGLRHPSSSTSTKFQPIRVKVAVVADELIYTCSYVVVPPIHY